MRVLTSLLAIALSLVPCAATAEHSQKPLSASDGWIKRPAAGETSAAAFVVVNNPTMYDVYLVSAASDVAEAVQFREAVKGGPAKEPAELTAPAYGAIEMSPDGVHLWLVKLKRALLPGESITITLTTDNGVTLHVPAVVR